MDKKSLSVRDIFSKFTSPAIANRRWGLRKPVREKIGLIKGGIVVRGKSHLNFLWEATLSNSTSPLLNNTLLSPRLIN
ncbi:hypothetical protein [Pseudomonas baetica]|uniref:hypothetical protein n=1 Tax=Pseudomonas baetica TaxID=674054 RepID=UPI0024055B15|nr:hypothetical protein [Pseudomonas baetica]MDF9776720.1 hypothetical protein [Pseudomonas baetica]